MLNRLTQVFSALYDVAYSPPFGTNIQCLQAAEAAYIYCTNSTLLELPQGEGPLFPEFSNSTPYNIFSSAIKGLAQACNMTFSAFNQTAACNFSAFNDQYTYSEGDGSIYWNEQYVIAAGPCNTTGNSTCFFNEMSRAREEAQSLYPSYYSPDEGLSPGAKLGIGLGVAVVAMGLYACVLRPIGRKIDFLMGETEPSEEARYRAIPSS
ncbi:MAG: hypothetical protein K0R66_1070 [Gammaproteobacteria bacterium]|jgi:hypothetical protein|nr:hypothetical protein [Gammaproteobacteria bacterium]